MMLKSIQGVIKPRKNTIKFPELTSQGGYIAAISDDSQIPSQNITEVKNIRTVKHTLINDPMQPEVTLVTAPRRPRIKPVVMQDYSIDEQSIDDADRVEGLLQ